MTTALEDLQEEVVRELNILTKDNLLRVCDFLDISGENRTDVEGKSCISLVTCLLKCLEREEVAELEDGSMAELLLLKDKITSLVTGTANGAAHTGDNMETADTQREIEGQRTSQQHSGIAVYPC